MTFFWDGEVDERSGGLAEATPRTRLESRPREGAGNTLPVDCGAAVNHLDRSGALWSRDRFFRGGRGRKNFIKILGRSGNVAEEDLYRNLRRFGQEEHRAGYRVPLPRRRAGDRGPRDRAGGAGEPVPKGRKDLES